VPADATLYIYADEMNDFNYYMQREVIPVVRSRAQIEKLLVEPTDSYILIKASDLKRLPAIGPERVRMTSTLGNTVWNLVALGSFRAGALTGHLPLGRRLSAPNIGKSEQRRARSRRIQGLRPSPVIKADAKYSRVPVICFATAQIAL
jgi:hypothetical protein